jgi:hypothetical protein
MLNEQPLRELFTGMDVAELYATRDIYQATKCRFGVLTERDNCALDIINGEIARRELAALSRLDTPGDYAAIPTAVSIRTLCLLKRVEVKS